MATQDNSRRKEIDAKRQAYYKDLADKKVAPPVHPVNPNIARNSQFPADTRSSARFKSDGGVVQSDSTEGTIMSKGALIDNVPPTPIDNGNIDPTLSPKETAPADLPAILDLDPNAPLIPGGYKDPLVLPWNDARSLARLFREGPVTNRADAVDVIEQEVARRMTLVNPETGQLLNVAPKVSE